MELRTLSLFSGIGGFEVAARRVGGFRVRKFVEIDSDAQTILKHHFPDIPIHYDIRSYYPERGEFDCIWGGFPCTNTSCAGNREGLEGKSSSLWWEQFRVIQTVRPQFSIIEQPTGVIDRGLRAILGGLRMAGYQSELEIISAAELGAGHLRPRLFIISYPYQWCKHFQQSPRWPDQVRKMVARQRLDSQWLTIRDSRSCQYNGLSVRLVQGLREIELQQCYYTEPTNTPGRIRARYLAGRTVTPAQAALALQRVKYLNQIKRKKTGS